MGGHCCSPRVFAGYRHDAAAVSVSLGVKIGFLVVDFSDLLFEGRMTGGGRGKYLPSSGSFPRLPATGQIQEPQSHLGVTMAGTQLDEPSPQCPREWVIVKRQRQVWHLAS